MWAKRLAYIIVGSHFETDDPVRFRSLSGQHQNWNCGVGPQISADGEPIYAWKHQVQDQQIRDGGGSLPFYISPVSNRGNAKPVIAQQSGQ
jgi:hypothetical protein